MKKICNNNNSSCENMMDKKNKLPEWIWMNPTNIYTDI